MLLPALLLCLPMQAPAPVPQKAIDAAIDRGVEYLISEQELDGSWRFHVGRHGSGITGYCVYTLLKADIEPDHQAVQRGLAYLDAWEGRTTYEVATMILAYAYADPDRYAGRLQQLADTLIGWNKGSWDYPGTHHDLSNTHFGTLGLRAAAHSGVEISDKVWERIGKSLAGWQESYGGIPYIRGRKSTLSMTAAGVGVACIVREAMKKSEKPSRRGISQMDTVISRGLRWLNEQDSLPHPEWKGNIDARRWDYYYLYGLQRVGVLTPVTEIAGKDWYQEGARWLVKKQGGKGQWGSPNGEPQPNTCHAILFLKRASAPVTGEIKSKRRVVRVEDPDAEVQFIVAGQAPLRMWIQSIHPLVHESWEWPDETDKGLRVRKVEYLSGDRVLASVVGNPAAPVKNGTYAAEVTFNEPGDYPIRVRVYLEPPPGDREDAPFVDSPELTVPVVIGLQDWMGEHNKDLALNTLPGLKAKVSASSTFGDNWKAAFVMDGMQGQGWLCAKDDAEPLLEIELKKALSTDVIVLSHAVQSPKNRGELGRAQKVRIRINKRKAFEVEMVMEPNRKTRVELPRTERIRYLAIELLDILPGNKQGKAAGLMEIELQKH